MNEEILCPRARASGTIEKPMEFIVADDPALMMIARMVVAGVDQRFEIHPFYERRVKEYGRVQTEELIRSVVAIEGACDVIQTDMCIGGVGLFGGLSEDGTEFVFYDWCTPTPWFRVHLTAQDARDIVSGKKTSVEFLFCDDEDYVARRREYEKESTDDSEE